MTASQHRSRKLLGRQARHWVVVTGMPRSGTTFLGKVLSRGLAVDYFHEPLNPMCGVPAVHRTFEVMNQRGYSREISDQLLALTQYAPILSSHRTYVNDSRSRALIKLVSGSRGPFMLRLGRLNPFSAVGLIKDPFASFAIPWFEAELKARTVGIVRHPVAVLASFSRLGWTGDGLVDALRGQADAIESLLEADRELLFRTGLSMPQSIGLVWRLTMNELRLREQSEGVLVVRHEDLSEEPVVTFERIAAHCQMSLSASTIAYIERSTSSSNRVEVGRGRAQDFARDSKKLLEHSLSSVSAADLGEVMRWAGPVANDLYS